ncbi:MAG: penicillin-binding transpeptidase domain-containing protein [Dehalococcoidia bacterium]|nr:penicillin-binding transpeptidase domain-containing protein [Dehalococcoidia bacterium]
MRRRARLAAPARDGPPLRLQRSPALHPRYRAFPAHCARLRTFPAPARQHRAFGQGELLATPLQMAVVAAVVANDGVLEQPHLGLAAYDADDNLGSIEGSPSERILTQPVARDLKTMMAAVVEQGQAAGVTLEGIPVAGKTGTAETGRGTSHAWFIAFAPVGDPQVAVAVLVEDGGQGSSIAAPIAGQVIQAAVQR